MRLLREVSDEVGRLDAVVQSLAVSVERNDERSALSEIRALRAHLDRVESSIVRSLRDYHATWEQVGELTGLSKPGAHKKWGRV
jgi:hypothetical protein